MPLVSVVIPVYCNAGSLTALHERLDAVARCQDDCAFEFIFVDDGSLDDSYTVLKGLRAQDERVRVVKLSRNFGSNAAVMAGLGYARGQCAAILSADLQDPPELIPEMLQYWRAGTKVVLATRRRRADPWLTRIPAAAFNRLFHALVFRDFPEGGFDYVLIDRRVVDVLTQSAEKNSYVFGLIIWAGFKRAIVYYDRDRRRHGRSMWTLAKKMKYFIDAFAAFSYLPLRLVSVLGLVIAAAAALHGLCVALGGVLIPAGGDFTLLLTILLLVSGMQMTALGIVGEYVWRALDQSRQRPLFVVDEVLGELTSSERRTACGSGL